MNRDWSSAALHVALLAIGWPAWCQKLPLEDREARAAAILFQRFESLAYSKPGLLTGSKPYDSLPSEVAKPLQTPFYILTGGLNALGNQAANKVFQNTDSVFVGVKDFRPPAGLGPVRSQNCFIVVLKNGSALELRNYFGRSPMSPEGGVPVWNWSAKLGEFGELDAKVSSLYAAKVAPSYLVVSNNLEELQAVAKTLKSSDDVTQVLRELRDWDSVRQHEMWGYRRYRHDAVANLVAAGMDKVDQAARALVFLFDREKNNFTLRVFVVPGEEGTISRINASGLFGRMKSLGRGRWERVVPLGDDVETLEQVASVMAMLGFGIYV